MSRHHQTQAQSSPWSAVCGQEAVQFCTATARLRRTYLRLHFVLLAQCTSDNNTIMYTKVFSFQIRSLCPTQHFQIQLHEITGWECFAFTYNKSVNHYIITYCVLLFYLLEGSRLLESCILFHSDDITSSTTLWWFTTRSAVSLDASSSWRVASLVQQTFKNWNHKIKITDKQHTIEHSTTKLSH